MSLHATGAFAPQDPITGAVIGPIWQADECLGVNVTYPGEVTAHPLQTGAIVTDAILVRPMMIRAELRVTQHGSAPGQHPLPGFKGRQYLLAGQLAELQAKRGPVRVWVRGMAPLSDYAIREIGRQDGGADLAITLSVDLVALEFASLFAVPLAVDVELLAAGLITP